MKQICCKFDNYTANSAEKDKENKVEAVETKTGMKITVFTHGRKGLEIFADRDQFGTFISFSSLAGGQVIAQEDETRSFLDSLIAALTEMKKLTLTVLPDITHC